MENNEDKEIVLASVIYTDGSADNRHDKRTFGFGCHGYIYDDKDKTGITRNKPTPHTVSNIGYLEPSELKIKEHTVVNPINYIDWFGAYSEKGTNNIAEVLGFIESVIKLIKMKVKHILVYTDSSYTLHVINKCKDKTREEINNTIDVNKDLWLFAREMHDMLKDNNVTLVPAKIKGHDGLLGNEMADDLALLGRVESERGVNSYIDYNISEPKGYWKPKVDKHVFLTAKQIFFTPNEVIKEDNSMEYYLFNYKEETEIGKAINTTSYSYVNLKEKDTLIESVKDVLKKDLYPHSVPCTVRLDNLFRADVFRIYDRYKEKCIVMDKKNNRNNVTVLENDLITNVIKPPALAYKAMDDMNILKLILNDFNKWKQSTEHRTAKEFIEISDMFYTINDKEKLVIKPELTNDVKTLDYDYVVNDKKGKIVIQLGKDIITRNQIKKLEKLEPRIYLVVMNNRNIKLQYYTIIDLEATGDQIVTTSFYANTVIVK